MTPNESTSERHNMNIGTRVSYEDMANPRREGVVVELVGDEYRVAWDEGGEAVSDCRQAGWKVLPAAGAREVDTFRRVLRNLEGAYRRLDGGGLTGRNSSSSDATREARYAELVELVRSSDAVCAELDRDDRLAARWNRVERRRVGLLKSL